MVGDEVERSPFNCKKKEFLGENALFKVYTGEKVALKCIKQQNRVEKIQPFFSYFSLETNLAWNTRRAQAALFGKHLSLRAMWLAAACIGTSYITICQKIRKFRFVTLCEFPVVKARKLLVYPYENSLQQDHRIFGLFLVIKRWQRKKTRNVIFFLQRFRFTNNIFSGASFALA